MEKQVIYSSFFSQEKWEQAEQSLKENGVENFNEDDISDQMLFLDYLDREGFQMNVLVNCDEFEASDIDGHLYISGLHSDGVNLYQLKELNEQGMRYYETWKNNLPWEDGRPAFFVLKKLMTNKYSRLPRYCEQLWGTNKEDK